MPDDPRCPCDGSDDPAQRCGRHHATGLASLYGGYQCCCGQPWRGAAKVCFTGAKAGDPVVADDPRPTPDDLDLLEMIGSRLESAQVCDADGVAALVGDVVSPILERLRALAATCSCGDTYETYAGPEADCPVHGTVRAYNEAHAEVERLRAELAEARGERVAGQLARIGDWEEIGAYARTIEVERDAALAAIDDTLRRMNQLRSWAYRDLNEEGLKNVLVVITHVLDCLDPDRTRGAALDASTAPESTDHAHDHASSHGGEHGAAKMRPVSVESPGNDGFRYEPEQEDA